MSLGDILEFVIFQKKKDGQISAQTQMRSHTNAIFQKFAILKEIFFKGLFFSLDEQTS